MIVGFDPGPAPGDGVVIVPLVENFVSLSWNRGHVNVDDKICFCLTLTRLTQTLTCGSCSLNNI